MTLSDSINAATVSTRAIKLNNGSAAATRDWTNQVIYHSGPDMMVARGVKPPATNDQNLQLLALMADGMSGEAAATVVFGPKPV